jgi:hypothetical protein
MAERRYSQNMYPIQQGGSPFAREYQSMYDPAMYDLQMQGFQFAQGRHDQVTGAMNEQLAKIGEMEMSDPNFIGSHLERYKEELDKIAKDYNYNYSQAKTALTQRMAKESANPLWQFNRELVNQRKLAQQMEMQFGGAGNTLWINDPRKMGLEEAMSIGDPAALQAQAVPAPEYTKIGADLMSNIQAQVADLGIDVVNFNNILTAMKTGNYKGVKAGDVQRVAEAMLNPFKAATANRMYDNRENYEWVHDDESIIKFLANIGSKQIGGGSQFNYQVLDHIYKGQNTPKRLGDEIFYDTFTGVGESGTDKKIRQINREADDLRRQAGLITAPGTQRSAMQDNLDFAKELVSDVLNLDIGQLSSNLEQLRKDTRRGKPGANLLVNRLFGQRERDQSLIQNDPEQLDGLIHLVHDYLALKYPEYSETGKIPQPSFGTIRQNPITITEDGELTVSRANQGNFVHYLTELLTEKELTKAEKTYDTFFEDQPLLQQEVFNGNMTIDEAINFGQQNEIDKYMTFSTSTDIPDPNARERLVRAVRSSLLGSDNIDGEVFLVSPDKKGNLKSTSLTRTKVGSLLGERDREIFNVTVTPYDSSGNTMLEFHTTKGGKDEIIRVPGKTGSNETKVLLEVLNGVMDGLYGYKTDRSTIELPDGRNILIRKEFVRSPYISKQGLEIPGQYKTVLLIDKLYEINGETFAHPEPVNPSDIVQEIITSIMVRSGQRVQQQPTNY